MKNREHRKSKYIAILAAFVMLFTVSFGETWAFAGVKDSVNDSRDTEETSTVKADPSDFMTDELLVVYEKSATTDAEEAVELTKDIAEETIALDDAKPVADLVAGDGACVLVTLDEDENVEEAKEELEKDENVAYVQPNFRYRMLETEAGTDPYMDEQYALGPWDKSFKTPCGANIAKAWELMGGAGEVSGDRHVTIAVLDSGCQVTHEDLSVAIDTEHAYDAVNDKVGIEYIKDQYGHGTSVAGIAAGVTGNGVGMAGAAGNYAKILPINIFTGKWSSTENMIAAFDYMEKLMTSGQLDDLHVVNLSVGGYGSFEEADIALQKCVDRMRKKGVLTVCAGGNGDENLSLGYKDYPIYPGDYEECLCVTSLDMYGINSAFSDYNMAKDISAPGEGIFSTMTDSTGTGGTAPDAKYGYQSGTSMASPLVAGIAALIFADLPDITCDQVVDAICSTAHEVNTSSNDHKGQTGSAGAIDAAEALNYARVKHDTKRIRLNSEDVVISASDYIYDGLKKLPGVSVTHGGSKLTENVDYLVDYSDNVEPGTAHVAVSGIGQYIGTISREYKIVKADIDKASVTLNPVEFIYDGKYHFPSGIEVRMAGKTLKWGKDYTVTALTDGISEGEHRIQLSGKGFYTGTKTVSYSIKAGEPATIAEAQVTGIVNKVYNGKNQTQTPKVVLNGVSLVKNKDYKLTYKNQKNVGRATVTITGIGNYNGTLSKTFSIIPKSTSFKSLSSGNKSLTAKWKSLSDKMSKSRITGYQIRVSANKNFTVKTTKTVTVKGYKKTSGKVTGLKAGKTYYVQVRTYMSVGGKKYYSKWSKINRTFSS